MSFCRQGPAFARRRLRRLRANRSSQPPANPLASLGGKLDVLERSRGEWGTAMPVGHVTEGTSGKAGPTPSICDRTSSMGQLSLMADVVTVMA